MLFKKRKKFALKIKPKGYGKYKQPMPKEIPDPKKGCSILTDSCNGLVLSWIVPSSETMNYDSVEETVKIFRTQVGDNCGIIECKNGATKKGHKFIYNIWKIKIDTGDNSIPDISYNLNINIKVGEYDYFINSNFSEVGMTGMRDSVGLMKLEQAFKFKYPDGNYTQEDVLKAFYFDPYDKENRKGLLMNVSETDIFDEAFPKHPLSEARKYAKWIIENN